ncbi:MAG: hypothetical protein FWG35_04525, partial [Spirochaetaceae bacterium]|nr:hypothetical protein [Spirochaetaceae bacterium]
AIVGNEKMFLEHGFQAFISKPIDVTHLDSILNTWIRDRQSEETLLHAEKESKNDEAVNPAQADGLHIFQGFEPEGVNFAEGLERYSSEEAYLELIRSYHLHTPVLLEKMRSFGAASPSNDDFSLSEYTIIVHGIKGSSYSISANAVGAEAEKLEKAARSGDFRAVMEGNASFIAMADSLLSDLGNLLQNVTHREAKPKKNIPDPELLSMLLEATKSYKAATMEQAVRQLETFEYESGGDLVVWLRDQMDNLEYEAIRDRLGVE